MSLKLNDSVPPYVQAFAIVGMCIAVISMIILAIDTKTIEYEMAPTVTVQQSEYISLVDSKETLDLAVEFGYDPLIVKILRQEARMVYRQRYCECPTWRFVRSEKELAFLLLSIVQVESRGDVQAMNPGGPAYGLTQLLLSTARQYDRNVTADKLLTIPANLHIAVLHFVDLLETFHGNHMLAVIAWNKGAGAVQRNMAIGGTPESGYAKLVFTQAVMRNAQ